MSKFAGMTLLLIGVAGFAAASTAPTVPEIDPASAAGALALVAGAVLVIRGRKK